jgi:hypothetical protein
MIIVIIIIMAVVAVAVCVLACVSVARKRVSVDEDDDYGDRKYCKLIQTTAGADPTPVDQWRNVGTKENPPYISHIEIFKRDGVREYYVWS